MTAPPSPCLLLCMPAEIRLHIYAYLLDDGGHKMLSVKHLQPSNWLPAKDSPEENRTRTRYLVMERTWQRRCYETTYALGTPDATFHTSIMATCRRIYEETSHILYGQHAFDFGPDMEAVLPFLRDRAPTTLPLISDISMQKQAPATPSSEFDRDEWIATCRYLSSPSCPVRLRRLRLVIAGGMPSSGAWDGPAELSERDLELLCLVKHESLAWVTHLDNVPGVEELEVVGEVRCCPAPQTSAMIIYAALSASIEKGLAAFLRKRLGIKGV